VCATLATPTASRVGFPEESRTLSKELSSYSYPRLPAKALTLNLSLTRKTDTVMTLDESPAFVRVDVGRTSVFVWSTPEVFDVLKPLAAEKEFELATDTYVPAIIFLRF